MLENEKPENDFQKKFKITFIRLRVYIRRSRMKRKKFPSLDYLCYLYVFYKNVRTSVWFLTSLLSSHFPQR